MKIACLGDIHGSDRWKEALNLDVDHILFVGDYVDSYEFKDRVIFDNFLEILQYKSENPDKVTLLLGNHDFHYLFFPDYRCSGFRDTMKEILQVTFQKHEDLFKIVAYADDYVFTHAGLTRTWVSNYFPDQDVASMVSDINLSLHRVSERDTLAVAGRARGGPAPSGGPIWADYQYELIHDPLPGINQVVGHTRSTFLVDMKVAGNRLVNVNYLAYSDEPIFILETPGSIGY